MKRLYLKIISIIICLCAVINVYPVFGAYSDVDKDSKYYDAVSMLEELGIVKGMEEGLFRPEVSMTRADFAIAFERILNREGSEFSDQQFIDVPSSNPAFLAINYMCKNGYIEGDGDGNYRPNDGMTLNEGLIVAARVLGYGVFSTDIMDNLSQKLNRNLTKKISIGLNEYLTRGDMCILLYNALNEPIVEPRGGVGDRVEYTINDDSSILSTTMDVQKNTGVFLADYNSAIYGTPTNVENDIVISYNHYTYDGESSGLVGKKVDFYVDKDGNVIAVFDKSEDSITVWYDDIDPKTNEYNLVYDNGRRTVTARISPNAYYAYNGMPAKTINGDLLKPVYGEVILTDFDDDRLYDSVLVWDYKGDKIRSVISSEEKIILDKTAKTITSDVELRIFKDGVKSDIASLSEQDFVLFAEADGFVTLYASSKKVTGNCTQINTTNNFAVIDSVQYGIIPGLANSIVTGTDVTVFIDKYGNIGYVEDVRKVKYGFVKKVYYDEDTEKTVLKMFCQDSKFHNYDAADKIRLKNGSANESRINSEALIGYFYDGTETKEQLVTYELNKEEEIVKLSIAEQSDLDDYGNENFVCNMSTSELKDKEIISSESSKYYNNYFYVEAKETELSFLTDSLTTVFYLPSKEKDWRVMTTSGLYSAQIFPSLHAYDMSEDGVVECVVARATGAISTGFSRGDTMLVVDHIVDSVNDEEEPGIVLSGMALNGTKVSFFAPEPEDIISGASEKRTLYYEAKLTDVKCGDVIQVKLNDNGEIHDFRLMYSYGDEEIAVSPFPDSEAADIRTLDREKSSFAFYGDVVEKGEKAIVLYNSLIPKKRSYALSGLKTVVYNAKSNRANAETGTDADIYAGAKVFAYMFPAYNDSFVVVYQ